MFCSKLLVRNINMQNSHSVVDSESQSSIKHEKGRFWLRLIQHFGSMFKANECIPKATIQYTV
jgi:hypothetical protein